MAYDVNMNLDPMAKQARIFCASIGLMPVGGTASTAFARGRLLIANPASSGRLIHMMGLTLTNATGSATSVAVHHNPTTGIPTAAVAVGPKNMYLMPPGDTSLSPPKAVVTGDTATSTTFLLLATANAALPVMGGSTGLLPPLVAPTNVRVVSNLSPILISPGASLGYDLTTGNSAGITVLSIYWWEEG